MNSEYNFPNEGRVEDWASEAYRSAARADKRKEIESAVKMEYLQDGAYKWLAGQYNGSKPKFNTRTARCDEGRPFNLLAQMGY